MTWNSDFQKDQLIAQRKREMMDAVREAEAMDPAETLRKQRATSLTSQLDSIMEAPDLSSNKRRRILLEWMHSNRGEVRAALQNYDQRRKS